jgi:hypothetical protein
MPDRLEPSFTLRTLRATEGGKQVSNSKRQTGNGGLDTPGLLKRVSSASGNSTKPN